jgi:hypothetical protein
MVIVPMPESFTIDNIELGPAQSAVRASITTIGEETLTFNFELVREGIGWKVSEIAMEDIGEANNLDTSDDDSSANDSGEDFDFDEEDWDFSDYDFDLGEEAPE